MGQGFIPVVRFSLSLSHSCSTTDSATLALDSVV